MDFAASKSVFRNLSVLFLFYSGCVGKVTTPTESSTDGGGSTTSSRCASDADCTGGVGRCQISTGQCIAPNCLTDGCDAGSSCDLGSLRCANAVLGDHPRYRGQTIAGHGVQSRLSTRDGRGLSALGDFTVIVATANGRYLYVVGEEILRLDQASMRVETISGLGWPGSIDGPADVAQFEVNFYQAGGIGLSPDERSLYFMSPGRIRRVDVLTGEAFTVQPTALERVALRGLAVGASGNVYVNDWGSGFWAITPSGAVEPRPLDLGGAWGVGNVTAPGFLAVDEQRGWAYGLDRNRQSGALYRWPLSGGRVEWLNSQATGTRDPVQYLSDGPVTSVDMANPAGLSIDKDGFLYIGAGDGQTFRRYNPDTQLVESLCAVAGTTSAENFFEWCIGDGSRNRVFQTWPSILTLDGAGNAYFGYTVWPRLVRLTRTP